MTPSCVKTSLLMLLTNFMENAFWRWVQLSQMAFDEIIPIYYHRFYLNFEIVLTIFRQLRLGVYFKGI